MDSEQNAPARMERRAKRYGFVASAKLTDLQSNIQLEGQTADLSLYGCCVSVDGEKAFPAATRVQVRITHNTEPFEAIGRVAYANSKGETGIAFVRVDGDDQTILEKWLYELAEVKA